MKFRDSEHESVYNELLSTMRKSDVYHIAVAYLLALDSVCREHIEDVFDIKEDVIIRSGLHKGWQTGTSLRTCRLAFNLWNGCSSDGEELYKDADGYENELPSSLYTPDSLFCGEYLAYYLEAVRLRFTA